jgi:hypothetical protein
MRELKQTAGALRTRRYRARRKNGERVFRVRLNVEDIQALRDHGYLWPNQREYRHIESAIHMLIAAMKRIKLKLHADRTLEWRP